MDHTKECYLVLPSNSSSLYFFEAATSCFTTQLPREIKLTGDWSIGLVEIHIPSTIMHIQNSETYYSFKLGDKDLYENDLCNFPHGVYNSIEQLAEEMNKAKDVSKHQILAQTLFQKGYYSLKRVCV